MPIRRANVKNAITRNVNVAPPFPEQEVTNAEFSNAIQIFAQRMTNHNNRVHAHVNENGGAVAPRVRDFVRMNPPEFLGLQTNEDP